MFWKVSKLRNLCDLSSTSEIFERLGFNFGKSSEDFGSTSKIFERILANFVKTSNGYPQGVQFGLFALRGVIGLFAKDPRKTWQLINELNSRHHKRKTIARIEIGDNKISSAADMAEAFNHHFKKIGHDLASEIPLVNTQPESFLISANKTFSFGSCCTSEVLKLLEKLEVNKATGLDNLPSKFSN